MATGSDVRDILDLEDQPTGNLSRRDVLFGAADKPKRKSNAKPLVKKPEGLSREVWGLLYSDSRDPPPIVPTDNAAAGYKQAKIKLGVQRVRPWRWTPFVNPARKDGLVLNHWRRVADEGKEYPFARFNKEVEVPSYSDAEYAQHLHDENWTKEETDHLFDLAGRFDLRFVIMQDRYDTEKYSKRSVEDLKERYYAISGKLVQVRSPRLGADEKAYVYDADHERKRKEQLRRLWDRTPEAIEEEQSLIAEMRKIEQRKKDREKRAGDIQKLLSKAADVSGTAGAPVRGGASASSVKSASSADSLGGASAGEARRGPDGKKLSLHKKKSHHSSPLTHPKARYSASESASSAGAATSASSAGAAASTSNGSTQDGSTTGATDVSSCAGSTTSNAASSASSATVTSSSSSTAASGIRFSEYKTSGVTLRSQRIKLPSSVGQKKTKAIESMLIELGIDVNPIPTEEIGEHFNDLRSDMVLLYELKSAVGNLEFELQTLRLRHQASLGGGGVGIGALGLDIGDGVAGMKEELASEAGSAGDGGDGNVSIVESRTGVEKEGVKKEVVDDGSDVVVMEGDEVESTKDDGAIVSRGGGGDAAAASSTPKPAKKLSEVADTQTQKKRKAALEQKNVLNKLKNR